MIVEDSLVVVARWKSPVALAVALLGGLVATAGLGAAQQGVVHVTFTMDAPFFAELPEAARRDVEDRLARIVIRLGQDEYGFLDWRPDGDNVPRLDVRLVEDPLVNSPAVCPPKLDLAFFGTPASGNRRQLEREARAITLYEACSLVSATDTSALRLRAQVVLDSAFRSSSFKRQLEEGLLNLVPFADRVEPADTVVVLPVPCERILLGASSRLAVLFVDRDPATGGESDGELGLHDPTATRAGRAFSLKPTPQTGLDRLAEADRDGRLIRLRVFMEEYHKSRNCERLVDSLVTS